MFFRQNYTVEIASDQVSKDNAYINSQDIRRICHPELKWYAEVIEGVSYAVSETADDEKRNTEKKRQVLLLAGELHGSGHNESTAYAQKSATDSSGT